MKNQIILLTVLGMFSCSSLQKTDHTQNSVQEALTTTTFDRNQHPLFSPIQMNEEGVKVYVHDYFPLAKSYSITHTPNGLTAHQHLDTFVLKGQMTQMTSHLSIAVNGETFDIPVKNHSKQEIELSFPTKPEFKNLKIKGSFNGWNPNINTLELENGVYKMKAWLAPGKYEYKLVSNGKEILDSSNKNTISNGIGGTNNYFMVGDGEAKKPFISSAKFTNKSIISTAFYSYKNLSASIFFNNKKINTNYITTNSGLYKFSAIIPEEAKKLKRSFIRIYAHSDKAISNDILIPLEYGIPITDASQLGRKDLQTNVMYEVFVDRFFDGEKSNNHPLNSNELYKGTDWYGGDLQGMEQKMNEGYFTDLGINSLWISPIIQNPKKMYGHMQEYGVDTKFTGYHGYWPVSLAKIDERFGNEKTLKSIISKAHNQNSNVLLDYVANHVHEEHPIVKNNLGWTTDLILPDGRKNIRLYDEQRLTTWFDEFMPTLDLARPEVAEVMSDSAVYWFKKYDIDGFRHDATKHIPISFWRLLTHKLKTQVSIPQNRKLYQIGETYGGPELVNSYVNSGMLDAQFDFNLFDAILKGVMMEDYSMQNIQTTLEASLSAYGSHHLMGNISGNHDKGRTISYADGSLSFNESSKEAGYTRNIENINGDLGYKKVAQMMAINLFIPGIPVIYYGDEIGMPGGDDPDNRRMMQFENLNNHQTQLKQTVKNLIKLRTSKMALLYGETQVLQADETSLVIMRSYAGKKSFLFVNKSDAVQEFNLELEKPLNQKLAHSHFGSEVLIKNPYLLYSKIAKRGFDIITLD